LRSFFFFFSSSNYLHTSLTLFYPLMDEIPKARETPNATETNNSLLLFVVTYRWFKYSSSLPSLDNSDYSGDVVTSIFFLLQSRDSKLNKHFLSPNPHIICKDHYKFMFVSYPCITIQLTRYPIQSPTA
jgi:hypothetical protein